MHQLCYVILKSKKIRFFDENFFLYWEDIDLMKRVKESQIQND